jgi:catechol 2,3-dioxygenase-like lactoylglutathione lyase family enzyme
MTHSPVPTPACPEALRIHNSVPMLHVRDVDKSVSFYTLLGFACDSRFSNPAGQTSWADISSGRARLMLARADGPVIPSQQAVLFYLYADDVKGLRTHLLQAGLPDAGPPPSEWTRGAEPAIPEGAAVFGITCPFYMPSGQLRVHDPDGYCLLIGQLR